MQATPEQIEMLEKLQEVDRVRLRAERSLKQLPYRDQVLELRKRKADVQAKQQKVDELLAKETRKMQRMETEDRQLAEKQEKTQAKIDGASGDYRAVNTWTKDLEVMAKRRASLEEQMTTVLAKLEEIERVSKQAQAGVRQLDEQEARLVKRHNDESAQLVSEVEKCQTIGRAVASKLPKELLEAYVTATKRCGGVGLSKMQDSQCSACRNVLDANRMLQVMAEAPVAECPSCHRLMIVQ